MWTELPLDAVQHVKLAFMALGLATLAGVPLGTLAALYGPARGPVLSAAGVGRTLPSLAVLLFLLPFLGVGTAPAVAALSLLALPPLIIAVDLGIRGVSPFALDAAAGMGMTAFQRFARVVVPLAFPVSFSGFRTAATETVASATLATFVGAGGLGDEIVRGLQTDDTFALFAGAAAVALLALATELLLGAIGRRMAIRA
jgi:osmoprotectant transport system permease protein